MAKTPAAPAAAQAEKPPEPTREHKRLIHLKLGEVYLDKDGRYDRGWSDQKVAADLGVPRAWVTHERKGYFGDGEGGEDVAEFLARLEAARIDTEKLVAAANAATSACEAMLARLRDLDREARPLRALVPA